MTRNELMRRIVLNEICDDYENVDQIILKNAVKEGVRLGLAVDRESVVEALAELVKMGLAKAYSLSGWEPFSTEIEGMPNLDVVEDFKTYFLATPTGLDVQLADDDCDLV